MTPAEVGAINLYHYTCEDHGAPGIERDGFLRLNWHPVLNEALTWVTDLEFPHREALGLTSRILSCDRTAIRYAVAPESVDECDRWVDYAKHLPWSLREALEGVPGAMPQHWWVSHRRLAVVRAPRLRAVR